MRNSCSEVPSCHERITGEQPHSASVREVPAWGVGRRAQEGPGPGGQGPAQGSPVPA